MIKDITIMVCASPSKPKNVLDQINKVRAIVIFNNLFMISLQHLDLISIKIK